MAVPPIVISLVILVFLIFVLPPKISPDAYMQKAENNITKAESLAKKKNPDKKKIQNLVVQALKTANHGVNLNPQNEALRRKKLAILIKTENLVLNSNKLITEEFVKLLNLSPLNPLNHFEYAKYLLNQGDNLDVATNQLNQTLSLKPDYAPAWFFLSKAYLLAADNSSVMGNLEREKSEKEKAKAALNEAKRLYCEVQKNLEECARLK